MVSFISFIRKQKDTERSLLFNQLFAPFREGYAVHVYKTPEYIRDPNDQCCLKNKCNAPSQFPAKYVFPAGELPKPRYQPKAKHVHHWTMNKVQSV